MQANRAVKQKEVNYNYTMLTRSELIAIENDSKSCLDRTLCNVAMLVSQYYGVATSFCKLQSNAPKKSNFRLRTALEDSKTT